MSLRLRVLPEVLGVARLRNDAAIPRWASSSKWLSLTRTDKEVSVVCDAGAIPDGFRCEKPFRAIEVEGPLDFSLTGVLASLATPLAKAKISILAISTFNTDYVLVRANQLPGALRALRAAGHSVIR